jgi:hypothetical protein
MAPSLFYACMQFSQFEVDFQNGFYSKILKKILIQNSRPKQAIFASQTPEKQKNRSYDQLMQTLLRAGIVSILWHRKYFFDYIAHIWKNEKESHRYQEISAIN